MQPSQVKSLGILKVPSKPAHTLCTIYSAPGPQKWSIRWDDPRPYLSQAGVLVHVLAFLHTGSQLLQDTPAACQRSGQPSKLPPAWTMRKRKETSSATSWRYTDSHTTSDTVRSRHPMASWAPSPWSQWSLAAQKSTQRCSNLCRFALHAHCILIMTLWRR